MKTIHLKSVATHDSLTVKCAQVQHAADGRPPKNDIEQQHANKYILPTLKVNKKAESRRRMSWLLSLLANQSKLAFIIEKV